MMKNKVKEIVLVVESGADFSRERAASLPVRIVPMHVILDGEDLCDGTFPVTRILDFYARTGRIPKTSAANVVDYRKTFKELCRKEPQPTILHCCYSAVTTATYQNVQIAAEGLKNVIHLDTKQVSAGQSLIVEKALIRMKEQPNQNQETLLAYLKECARKTHMAFIPRRLDFLRAGGRVSNAAMMGANILKLKPVIELKEEQLICTEKIRGSDYRRLCIKLIREKLDAFPPDLQDMALVRTPGLEADICEAIEAELRQRGLQNVRWHEAGGVITTHGGPGVFGFAFSEIR